jgi:glycosyltransferase involved in cell wall biosynthesis
MSEPVRVAIVVPCYNEAAGVEQFHTELVRALEPVENLDWRVHFIDDGSTDATLERLNRLAQSDRRVRVYALSRNFGHQIALSAGLDVTRGAGVIMMDADLQHPPAILPAMIALWRQGYDVVSAVRQETRDASWFKSATARLFYRLINLLGDTAIVPGAADFCLLSPRAHDAVCAMPERHRFLRGLVSWIGFDRAYVPFQAPPRGAGETKYTMIKMTRLALDAVFSFSAAPMRLATRLGLALFIPGSLYVFYILIAYAAGDQFVRGWGSLIGSLMIIGGIQLICLGIIGEYLSRVFEEAKQRPLYFFKQVPDATDG